MPTASVSPATTAGTRAWRTLVAQVLKEEKTCWLRLPGCTVKATVGDHVVPVSLGGPSLARANVRGACRHCNRQRSNTPVSELPALRRRLEAKAMGAKPRAMAVLERAEQAVQAMFGLEVDEEVDDDLVELEIGPGG